jgi:alkylation response protein AidB-like acyl-CoA dehydrogenase
MNTLNVEERAALRESVHRLLSERSTEADVRATMDTSNGFDPQLWHELSEMGIVGLIIDEAAGGSGVGPMELEVVMEEVGAALLCSPLLASSVIAAELLRSLGNQSVNERLLREMATGRCIATAAITGDSGCWTPEGVSVTANKQDGEWLLDGRASYVLHGQNADVLLVIAKADDSFMAFEVASDTNGVSIDALPTFDHTLRLASLSFESAKAKHIETQVPVWKAVQSAIDLGLVALAGEQAGAARKVLEFTVEYAKTRIQFGRQIGSFQAIKHMSADLLLETESATSAARDAAQKLAQNSNKSLEAISLAAFACADAFVKTTADAIQMHGGIAFTWEHPAHLYLKRARADAQLLGSPAYYREQYLQQLGA